MSEIVIAHAVCSAVGSVNSLGGVPAHELGAMVVREGLQRASSESREVEEIILGQVLAAGAETRRLPDGVNAHDEGRITIRVESARGASLEAGTALYTSVSSGGAQLTAMASSCAGPGVSHAPDDHALPGAGAQQPETRAGAANGDRPLPSPRGSGVPAWMRQGILLCTFLTALALVVNGAILSQYRASGSLALSVASLVLGGSLLSICIGLAFPEAGEVKVPGVVVETLTSLKDIFRGGR